MKTWLQCSCLAATLVACNAHGQSWPTKPVHIITVGAGGAVDLGARLISQSLTPALGQSFVVENRSATSRMEQLVLKSAPDGSTLLYWSNALWLAPFMQDTDYDPVKDFAPVSLVAKGPGVVAINPAVPANTLKELVDLAKARPGQLNVAVTSPGSSAHLAAVLFKTMAGIDITTVFYKAATQSLNDLVAGRVQVMFPTLATPLPTIKAGKLRALAITTAEPTELLPGVPPVAQTYPGYDQGTMHALFAAGNTPPAIVNRINQEVVRAVRAPEIKEKLFAIAVDVVGSSPEQLAALIKSDMAKTGKIIKDNGIRAQE